VLATSFSEYAPAPNPATGKKDIFWFALSSERPLFAFAGLWTPWTGTRGTKAKPVEGTPSIVPSGADQNVYLVFDCNGRGWDCVWRRQRSTS
jgi:putative SOS response-associated peptidase YedK